MHAYMNAYIHIDIHACIHASMVYVYIYICITCAKCTLQIEALCLLAAAEAPAALPAQA